MCIESFLWRFFIVNVLKPSVQEGFTLIELLVVIAIIGILAAAAVPQILSAICDSRVSAAQSEISTIRTAAVQCQMDSCEGSDGVLQTDDLANAGLVPEAVNENYNISASGTQIQTISRADIGCTWNDGSTAGTGMLYNVDSGKFTAFAP